MLSLLLQPIYYDVMNINYDFQTLVLFIAKYFFNPRVKLKLLWLLHLLFTLSFFTS